MKLDVFISWSRPRSRQLAEALAHWLPRVIQVTEPWMSPDVEKGSRWQGEISRRLGVTDAGVICLTKENLESPWILFEAGALSKNADARVCTVLLDVLPSDVQFPLAQFQHTTTAREDVWRLLLSINEAATGRGLPTQSTQILRDVFEAMWPTLDAKLAAIPHDEPAKAQRQPADMLAEILDLVRGSVDRDSASRRLEQPTRHYRVRLRDGHPRTKEAVFDVFWSAGLSPSRVILEAGSPTMYITEQPPDDRVLPTSWELRDLLSGIMRVPTRPETAEPLTTTLTDVHYRVNLKDDSPATVERVTRLLHQLGPSAVKVDAEGPWLEVHVPNRVGQILEPTLKQCGDLISGSRYLRARPIVEP